MVYEYRDCFVVSYSPSGKGYEGVLGVRGSAEGVRLYFNQGKPLPDPEKLLQGTGGQVRWIPLGSASALARPAVVRLIAEALAGNRVPFALTGRGPLVLQSIKAQPPRPKRAK